jgi:hypothetical protein
MYEKCLTKKMPKKKKQSEPIWLVGMFLAWLVPGAGHAYIGRGQRGIILFIAISATFWAGIAMGGTMTVDRPYEPWWFTAQMLTGVNGLIGWYRQDQVYRQLTRDEDVAALAGRIQNPDWRPGDPIKLRPTSPRPDDLQMLVDKKLDERKLAVANPTAGVARAYSGVAGMLNLLCIFDVLLLCLMGKGPEPTLSAGKIGEDAKKA